MLAHFNKDEAQYRQLVTEDIHTPNIYMNILLQRIINNIFAIDMILHNM